MITKRFPHNLTLVRFSLSVQRINDTFKVWLSSFQEDTYSGNQVNEVNDKKQTNIWLFYYAHNAHVINSYKQSFSELQLFQIKHISLSTQHCCI